MPMNIPKLSLQLKAYTQWAWLAHAGAHMSEQSKSNKRLKPVYENHALS